MEDDEYKKLPLDERCVHKLWKARVNGYEEVTKLFRQIDDEKSPEFAKYLGLVKKFVTDSNAMGQEKGLEATMAFAENYANAGKTVGEVMNGIVTKCMAAPKTKTRELALQVTLIYIEIEKQEAVVEELLKGMDLKNPKIVAACISALTTALREFGSKVIQLKPAVKKIPVLFADRDKNVRDEARLLVIEMYRWIGAALKPQLSSLQPVQVTELEAEFAKIDGHKAVPTRYLRSQQEKQAKLAVEAAETGDVDEDDEGEVVEPVNLDPYEMADPIDILSKLPKDFYDKLDAKKWQERKEALETLENLVKNPKLENGDYGDLVRALKKMIQKDSNVVVVALAAKCLNGVACGLKKRFQPYAGACIPAILEKFKEKKQNVVVALREAIDTMYLAATLDNILEDILEALGNKNPSVKTETSLFLARAFTKTVPAVINKKILKAMVGSLLKLVNEPDPAVRDGGAEAIGTLMKLVGDKAVAPFLVELEKDANKMSKIKEYCEKAVIIVKVPGAKREKPKSKAEAPPAKAQSAPLSASAPKAPTRRAATAVKKRAGGEISSGTATIVKSRGKTTKAPAKVIEKELSDEEVAEIVGDMLPNDVINGLADANWKNRLSAVESFLTEIQSSEASALPVQALVRTLCKKPGLKDINFQVLKARLDTVKVLATTGKFSVTSATYCLNDITEKLGDAKNGASAGEALTTIAEATTLGHVSTTVFDFALSQKSPKVLQETLIWIGNAIKEFGFANLNPKFLIDNAKKALASNNAQVRGAAVSLFGVLFLYMGHNLQMFIENEKPALRDQINAEFDKYENEKPPAPIRGVVKSASTASMDPDTEADEEASGDAPAVSLQDLLPRTDISGQITESLLVEMADKNWKVRNEALIKVSNIINDAKLIKPNIGDLPQALAHRLVDSNSKIAQTALNICETIATAMGPPCKQHIRALFPGFLQGLGDSKAWIRSASVQCMNAFAEQAGYKEFFEGEMIYDALKTGSPTLRSELWLWLAEKLPKIKQVQKEELIICIPYLYANVEDRNADVRKNANEAVLGVMIHVGYESMVKQLEKVKPASKSVIQAQLEKVRPNLPAKPMPVKKQAAQEDKVVKSGGARPSSTKAVTKPAKAAVVKPVARSKKEDDVDTSPLLVINNLKHQRAIDESKLKVLKWNFTTPRQEFVELLRDQMTTANLNKTLIANMFHTDFKFHIKAIESLSDDLQGNSKALVANLDLILKWLTLRFFDTNPSVLLKGLEYLSGVFQVLIEEQYHLLENEATCFIPYLITKIGDPKDAVRNGVKTVIKQLWSVYPVNKLFTYYLMEGLKSKNARQRAECLEAMALTIANHGLNICIPTPQACLKEIAKQLSDRDNSVRNGALNCAVQAYYIVGEKIFKMVGNISDKDMSLLEERIKRAGKKPPPQPQPLQTMKVNKIDLTQNINLPTQLTPTQDQCDDEEDLDDNDNDEDDDDNLPEVALPSQVIERQPKRSIPNPYQLDSLIIQQLDDMREEVPTQKVEEFDLNFLNSEVLAPSLEDARARVIPVSPPKPILPTEVLLHRQPSAKSADALALERYLLALGGSNITKAMEAVSPLEDILRANKGNILADYEERFITTLSQQLFNLHGYDLAKNQACVRLYRNLLTLFESFFSHPKLGRKISTDSIKLIISEFLKLLVEDRLDEVHSKESYIRVLNLHCVKLIERSDHTNCICALVQYLHECVRFHGSCRLTDIVMKCLWRVIKIIPTWEDDIDCDRVLLDIHNFFKEFPTNWWKTKPADTPIRTIKTILHSIAKIKGARLTEHLVNIPNINDSELELFIHKMIRSLKLDEVKQVPLKTESRKILPRSSHTQLTDIFHKIGCKEETKEGLNLLYDFLQQNPESDIDPFLQRSSQFFQEYIQRNLKEIEKERKNPSSVQSSYETNGNTTVAGDVKDVDYYRQRLAQYKESWDRKNANMD